MCVLAFRLLSVRCGMLLYACTMYIRNVRPGDHSTRWMNMYVQWDNNNEANIRPVLSASVPSVHTTRAKECVSGVRRMQSPKWILNYAWNFERLPDDRHIWTGPRECVHTVYNCLAVQLLHTNHHSPSRAMLSATAAVWFLFSINYAVSSYFISAWRILQFLANFGARARASIA